MVIETRQKWSWFLTNFQVKRCTACSFGTTEQHQSLFRKVHISLDLLLCEKLSYAAGDPLCDLSLPCHTLDGELVSYDDNSCSTTIKAGCISMLQRCEESSVIACQVHLLTSIVIEPNAASGIASPMYVALLGLLTACWSLTGYDAAAHLIE